MQYLLGDKAYTILKWVGLVAVPAVAVFVGTVGDAWGLPYTEQIVTTLNAAGVLIGALVAVSAGTATNEELQAEQYAMGAGSYDDFDDYDELDELDEPDDYEEDE